MGRNEPSAGTFHPRRSVTNGALHLRRLDTVWGGEEGGVRKRRRRRGEWKRRRVNEKGEEGGEERRK